MSVINSRCRSDTRSKHYIAICLLDVFGRQKDDYSCGLEVLCDLSSTVYRLPQEALEYDTERPLVNLIDFESPKRPTWMKFQRQLEPLRSQKLLTYFNGSTIIHDFVLIVSTGYVPCDAITANNTYREIFYNAPLDLLAETSIIWLNLNRAQAETLEVPESMRSCNVHHTSRCHRCIRHYAANKKPIRIYQEISHMESQRAQD